MPDNILRRPFDDLNETNQELVAVAIGCAKVLDSLSSSPKVKEELYKYGVVKLMERFLKSTCTSLIIPMMGTVQQCATLVCKIILIAHQGIDSLLPNKSAIYLRVYRTYFRKRSNKRTSCPMW